MRHFGTITHVSLDWIHQTSFWAKRKEVNVKSIENDQEGVSGVSNHGRDARLEYICQSIARGRFISFREITGRFDVNIQTARRDVMLLASQNKLTKVHGGAISREDPDILSVEARLSVRNTEKRHIAEMAAGLISDGDVIFLDGGSTTAFLAPLLLGRSIHVVTNAISLVQTLKTGWPDLDVIVTGGYYYPKSELLLGPSAVESLKNLQINKAFLSAAGVTADGVFNTNMLVVDLERAVIGQAMETYLLADSSKLERTSLVRVCGLEAISTLITTGPVPVSIATAAASVNCHISSYAG